MAEIVLFIDIYLNIIFNFMLAFSFWSHLIIVRTQTLSQAPLKLMLPQHCPFSGGNPLPALFFTPVPLTPLTDPRKGLNKYL